MQAEKDPNQHRQHTGPPAHHEQERSGAHEHAHDHTQDAHAHRGEHAPMEPGHRDAHAGHGADHRGHEQMFRTRFWICTLLSIPVLAYSPMLQEWFGYSAPAFPGNEWVTLVFSLVVFGLGGVPFVQMAIPELRNRRPGMMTLITLAISVALIYSVSAQLVALGEGFFWELVTLIDVMLLGHWVEMRSVRRASGALDELAKLMPDTAEKIMPDGAIVTVPSVSLRLDDLLLVRPGASVPADGEVAEGRSSVNEAMITGESSPVDKGPGEKVIAGTINGDGSLRVRVTATGDDTALAGIMRLVEEAQQSKSDTQILADRAAGWLFYIALAAAAATLVAWTVAVGPELQVLQRVVTVLVIACPHALGLAVPLVVAIVTELGARNGILVRDRLALEAAREIDIVVFDKTGTLTEGVHQVVGIATAESWDEERALAWAAAVEGDSEHMIARAMREAARARSLEIPVVSGFEALKGRGVRAELDGQVVYVGGPNLLDMLSLTPPENLLAFREQAAARAQSVVYLVAGGRVVAALAVADAIRPESRTAVELLRRRGMEVAMLTGDSQAVADAVARQLGVDLVYAQVLPEHKADKVMELQAQGRRVAMVGDGVNDAPALVRADVGIAVGGGTDVAIESAGLILVRSNPMDVAKIFALSRASYRKMVQNLWWAAGYNVVALPLAAGVAAPWGVVLTPAVGALLMSLSTVIVALNAQLLRRVELSPEGHS
jgi:Cu2+-exporting ATPase